jgi:hypothetical protein
MVWQQMVVVEVGGQPYQLTHDETRDLVRWLRKPNPHVPTADLKSVLAAVLLERLLEDPAADNPPLEPDEADGMRLALMRMEIREGLTPRQQALYAALFGNPPPGP